MFGEKFFFPQIIDQMKHKKFGSPNYLWTSSIKYLKEPPVTGLTHSAMTNSWFINSGAITVWGPYNFAAWTVTTLTFFYLVFPLTLPFLQSLTTSQLITITVWLHHLQVQCSQQCTLILAHTGLAHLPLLKHGWS